MRRTLVWFRGKDLRLADHRPLHRALAGGQVIPLFVLDPYFFAPARARALAPRMRFLLDSLAALSRRIEALGSRLLVVEGRSVDVVPRLAARLRVDEVVAQRWTEPFAVERDRRIAAALSVPFRLEEGETLVFPGSVRTLQGASFSVFSPFSRALRKLYTPEEPLPAPRALPPLPADLPPIETSPIPSPRDLGLLDAPAPLAGGEAAAEARLAAFLAGPGASYASGRDRLGAPGTSRLSADLKFGTLSPRTVWHRAAVVLADEPAALLSFENELLWREFTHHILHFHPRVLAEPFRPELKTFEWSADPAGFDAWAAGRTGYPVVDAAQRQLLTEAWVHNRARMISASFLTKHLLVDYRRGEAHYLRHLVDGDWAQNNFGWQWSAGTGCDAQPYFRVFNPVSQGRRFDADGAYVRRHVPELARLPDRYLHAPWEAPPHVLAEAGVRLGDTYPRPIVELAAGRTRFLEAMEQHAARRATGELARASSS